MKTVSTVCDQVKVPTIISQNSPSRRGILPLHKKWDTSNRSSLSIILYFVLSRVSRHLCWFSCKSLSGEWPPLFFQYLRFFIIIVAGPLYNNFLELFLQFILQRKSIIKKNRIFFKFKISIFNI